jgi:hypothetical protein
MPALCNKRKNKIEPVGYPGARWSVHSEEGTEPARKISAVEIQARAAHGADRIRETAIILVEKSPELTGKIYSPQAITA